MSPVDASRRPGSHRVERHGITVDTVARNGAFLVTVWWPGDDEQVTVYRGRSGSALVVTLERAHAAALAQLRRDLASESRAKDHLRRRVGAHLPALLRAACWAVTGEEIGERDLAEQVAEVESITMRHR